ncbi:MAG TPA: translation elongation factor Ts [Gemmatimonadales bacterium]|nr:translation elongation factor Ts [Gemmatimonadales bacterium]
MSTTITTKDIAELRGRTGAGMMDCKNALEEAGGDMERAGEILRKKGIAKAEKRAGRDAAQGLVVIASAADGSGAAMLELNSETDFVARNETFQALARQLVDHALAHSPVGVTREAFLAESVDGKSIEDTVKEASGTIGEAISIKRVARFGGVVGEYRHFNAQVGVLVEVEGASGGAAVALAREIALHVASEDPVAVTREDIPQDLIDRERRIAEELVIAEGKPEAIRSKIVEGKVAKFASDRALIEQAFIKDESMTVGALVAAVPGARVVRFARFKIGEA